MPLTTYEEVKAQIKAIRGEVLSGRMPPWTAAPGFGDFSNDAGLSPIELELLTRWLDGGAPRGDAVLSRPPVSKMPEGFEVVRLPLSEIRVTGGSTERFEPPASWNDDRWIGGWRFEPGVASLVEGVTLSIRPNGARIGSWTPFDSAVWFPAGTGERLPKGTSLTLDVRYRKSTEPRIDRSSVTVYFRSRPAHEIHHRVVACGAGEIVGAIDVVAVRPQLTRAGDSIEVVSYGADGRVEPLCVLSRYLPEYPITYRLRTPVRLDRGAQIRVSARGDCAAAIDYVDRRSALSP